MTLTTNVNLRNKIMPAYIVGNDFFTDAELDSITNYCDNIGVNTSILSNTDHQHVTDFKIRKSKSKFFYTNTDTSWFFQRTLNIFDSVNNDCFGFGRI